MNFIKAETDTNYNSLDLSIAKFEIEEIKSELPYELQMDRIVCDFYHANNEVLKCFYELCTYYQRRELKNLGAIFLFGPVLTFKCWNDECKKALQQLGAQFDPAYELRMIDMIAFQHDELTLIIDHDLNSVIKDALFPVNRFTEQIRKMDANLAKSLNDCYLALKNAFKTMMTSLSDLRYDFEDDAKCKPQRMKKEDHPIEIFMFQYFQEMHDSLFAANSQND